MTPKRPWGGDEADELLMALRRQGMSLEAISLEMNWSISAVCKHAKRLGLCDSQGSFGRRPPKPDDLPPPRPCIGMLCRKTRLFQPKHKHNFMCQNCSEAATRTGL